MKKDVSVHFRTNDEHKAKLDELCTITHRKQSKMLEHLIAKEWAEIMGVDWRDESVDLSGLDASGSH